MKEYDALVRSLDDARKKADALYGQATAVRPAPIAKINLIKKPKFYDWVEKVYFYNTFQRDRYKTIGAYGSAELSTVNSIKQRLVDLEGWHNESMAEIEAAHEQNKEAIEHNKKVWDYLKKTLDDLGVKDYAYTKHVNPRRITAPWVNEIRPQVLATDNYITLIANVKDKYRRIVKYGQELLKKVREEEAAQKKKQEETAKMNLLLKMAVKYQVATNDPNELFDAITEKCKYLDLAYEMMATRNYVDNGVDGIEARLAALDLSNDTDIKIHNSVNDVVASWDGDGRIFRDCEWNYTEIMALADPELAEDAAAIYELTERF